MKTSLTLLFSLTVLLGGCGSRSQNSSEKDPSSDSGKAVLTGIELASSSEAEAGIEAPLSSEKPAQHSSIPAIDSNVEDAPKRTKTFDLTFDDLKFEMDYGGDFERSMLTQKIKSYDGELVTIRGYVHPTCGMQAKKFVFVRDNNECCFGRDAAVFDNMLISMATGTKIDYTVRPVTLTGKLSVKEYRPFKEAKVWSIYRLRNAEIK